MTVSAVNGLPDAALSRVGRGDAQPHEHRPKRSGSVCLQEKCIVMLQGNIMIFLLIRRFHQTFFSLGVYPGFRMGIRPVLPEAIQLSVNTVDDRRSRQGCFTIIAHLHGCRWRGKQGARAPSVSLLQRENADAVSPKRTDPELVADLDRAGSGAHHTIDAGFDHVGQLQRGRIHPVDLERHIAVGRA